MLLVVDVGNTQTVIGIYESVSSSDYKVAWRISTDKTNAPDDLRVKLIALLQDAGLDGSAIDSAAMASVVPALGEIWMYLIKSMFGIQAIRCCADIAMKCGLFETTYPNPSEIGADRVADAIALRSLYGPSSIVVDFGTATNIEILDSNGVFVGGIIAPGMMTGASAMFAHATKLAATDLSGEVSVVGYDTAQAIRSGVVLGEAVRADGLVFRAVEELEGRIAPIQDCNIVATGGLAGLIAEHSRVITDVREDLTLIGLRLLAEEIL